MCACNARLKLFFIFGFLFFVFCFLFFELEFEKKLKIKTRLLCYLSIGPSRVALWLYHISEIVIEICLDSLLHTALHSYPP